jgi:hypothetical protein
MRRSRSTFDNLPTLICLDLFQCIFACFSLSIVLGRRSSLGPRFRLLWFSATKLARSRTLCTKSSVLLSLCDVFRRFASSTSSQLVASPQQVAPSCHSAFTTFAFLHLPRTRCRRLRLTRLDVDQHLSAVHHESVRFKHLYRADFASNGRAAHRLILITFPVISASAAAT